MKSNYKKLGEYIQAVNIRNKDLEVETLLGVSIKKILIPSIANTIGTNMKTYKIIKRNQFAYGPVTSRNGNKISVAISEDYDEAIVSQAYTVFEVKDKNELNPEYLMMWMRRPEFDRYARFKSHGSAREVFDWDELCEVELPIPSIEKQEAIVKEYNTVVKRIKINEQLNQKLEETAQALYKHWFVDFEFPNAEGKAYKSSGGKMVYNKELDKEIPEVWESISVYEIAKFINGASFKDSDFTIDNSGIPIIKIAELKNGLNNLTKFTNENKKEELKINNGTVLYSWSGNPETSLEVFKWFGGEAWLNQHIFKVDFSINQNVYYTYYTLKNLKQKFIKLAQGKQTTGLGHITVADMKNIYIPYPGIDILKTLQSPLKVFYDADSIKQITNKNLLNMKNLLLSKMTKVKSKENEKQENKFEKELELV